MKEDIKWIVILTVGIYSGYHLLRLAGYKVVEAFEWMG